MHDNNLMVFPPDPYYQVKEDVEYYIENCQEPDFEEDDGIYDELDLDVGDADNLFDNSNLR